HVERTIKARPHKQHVGCRLAALLASRALSSRLRTLGSSVPSALSPLLAVAVRGQQFSAIPRETTSSDLRRCTSVRPAWHHRTVMPGGADGPVGQGTTTCRSTVPASHVARSHVVPACWARRALLNRRAAPAVSGGR